ncbi:MAG: 16S rRNA (cytosine(1402)-N(4))-methyltransferase RsmH [Glycomyces artemisiae]|uniref:Ribosomal RNA small subunit methyltransferase H n=1 Tax=Glycomyces artemisiae TaxID=1076443 RepID=A0A2T0UKR2_9ACTN|nr:16S rRNA (cytosine(1402)-N(4))-methyltransferase RsmH [Glycomyces artemisiae]NUQ88085.1 16S rRNA (cytosine(1402)-N(4))-methyltransferase RsmH [Glycomyces artemisiae]PRY58535.1 16S rRNA (cytosine1402-N4)-methyltransferase [Glycomyces artemisiae]
MNDAPHVPVMLDEVLGYLAPAASRPGAVYVDATLGAGGHAEAMLTAHPGLTVIGVDRDPNALDLASKRLAGFGDRFVPARAVYDAIPDVLRDNGFKALDAVLFDLGVSSMQLDQRDRGFAYSQDAPLDMRMNPDDELTAEIVVNTYEPGELVRILRTYGEEKFATRVVSAIVKARDRARITSSSALAELVKDAIPQAGKRTGGNPAKRTFQALRIEVNGELDTWERALPAALDVMNPGGRIVVLSYHSLEDRITKQELAKRARSNSPAGLPVDLPGTEPTFRLLTKKAQQPTQTELDRNPRSAPARLRAAERIAPSTGAGGAT